MKCVGEGGKAWRGREERAVNGRARDESRECYKGRVERGDERKGGIWKARGGKENGSFGDVINVKVDIGSIKQGRTGRQII